MRLFKTRWVARFTRRERIADAALWDAVDRAERGLVDADLGGGLIKQRVARPNQGRSGGYRMLIGYKVEDRAIFLFGFSKSDLDNIDLRRLTELRELGAFWLAAKDATIVESLADGAIMEVDNEKEG